MSTADKVQAKLDASFFRMSKIAELIDDERDRARILDLLRDERAILRHAVNAIARCEGCGG